METLIKQLEKYKKRETAKKNNLNYVELFNKEDINLFLINLQNIKDEKLK